MSATKSLINRSLAVCLIVCLASGVFLTPARAQERAVGSLSVVIRPEALVNVPTSTTASAETIQIPVADSSWALRFDLPVSVKIRLAQGVAADLIIDTLTDPAQLAPGLAADIQVNGVGSGTFSARIPIDKSGMHPLNAAITLRGSGTLPSGTLPIRLTLRSHDGTIEWTQVVQLNWAAAS